MRQRVGQEEIAEIVGDRGGGDRMDGDEGETQGNRKQEEAEHRPGGVSGEAVKSLDPEFSGYREANEHEGEGESNEIGGSEADGVVERQERPKNMEQVEHRKSLLLQTAVLEWMFHRWEGEPAHWRSWFRVEVIHEWGRVGDGVIGRRLHTG